MGYLALVDSSAIAVEADGRVPSFIEDARSKLQGKRFWTNQLMLIDEEIEKIQINIQKDPERRASLIPLIEKIDNTGRNPNLKYDDPREIEAAKLRGEAEKIEFDIRHDKLQKLRVQKLEELLRIRQAVRSKLEV